MRANSPVFDEFNQSSSKSMRLVIKIGFPTPFYLTSHDDIPNIPAGAVEGVIVDVSSRSQRLVPDEGRSEIGDLTFSILDEGGAATDEFRAQEAAGYGLKKQTVELYVGGRGMDWSDFRVEQTQQIDSDVTFDDGVYSIKCADIQREMRADMFDLASTRLAAQLDQGETTSMTVFDTSAFSACTHVSSFGDESSGTWFYLKIKYNNGFEIIKAESKTSTTFTTLTRGMFGTSDVTHELPSGSDDDAGVEIEEYPYLEMPFPALVYAALTGDIIGGGTIPWSLGIDTTYVDVDSFSNIGEDWFDPSDYTKGLIFRFQGLSKTDGKQFIEKECCLLAGAYLRVGSDGKLYLRRMTGIIESSDFVATINVDNAIAVSEVKHDLSRLRNTYDIEWSWVQLPGESEARYVRRNVLVDATSIAIHGESDALELKFKGLHNERHTYTTLRNRFDAVRDRYAGPPITMTVDLLPSMNDLEVGDIVRAIFPYIRDYTAAGTLDRSFEIERTTVNQATGRVTADLFGSTMKASPIADAGAGASAELPDSWYDDTGTDMDSELSIDGSGFLLSDDTLTGGTTTRTVYYYLGDFTIPSGRTLEITGNVELRILGVFQNNGTLIASGGLASNTAGYLGRPIGGRAILLNAEGGTRTYPGPRVPGAFEVLPVIEIENNSGDLVGIPADMRGSGGAVGGDVWAYDTGSQVSQASGGDGGTGGGSVVIVSRGAGFGVAGQTVLSGEDGSTGGNSGGYAAGSGGGGAPGTLLHVLDGSSVTVPILAGNVVAAYGTSPVTSPSLDSPGKATAADPIDLGVACARVIYVPKSRSAYPDFDNDNFGGSLDGHSVLIATVYQRAASLPSTPTGGSYNFGTKTLTPPSGWSASPPASDGNPLYASTAIFEVAGSTGTDSSTTWTTPEVLVVDGVDGDPGASGDPGDDGADGTSSIVAQVFIRAASAPSTPTGGSYNFTTSTLTPPSSWSVAPPASDGNPLYVSTAVFSVSGTTGTDSSTTWTSPNLLVQDGLDGFSSIVVDPNDWTTTVTDPMGDWDTFSGNGSNTSIRTDVEGPFGEFPLVMEILGNGSAPGWYDSWRHHHEYDKDKSYIYFSWVKRISSGTTKGLYVGFTANEGDVVLTTAGSPTTNPYIVSNEGASLTVDDWYLIVGIIHPDGYTGGDTGKAGIYDVGGNKVVDGNEYIWNGQEQSTAFFRQGFYSNTTSFTTSDGFQFTRTLGYVVDGTEPSIAQVLQIVAVDGLSVYHAIVYKRAASTPSTPTGGSYNFGTKTLTPPSTWSVAPPASDGNPLYASVAEFAVAGQTGTDSSTTWTGPEVLVVDGVDGDPGASGDPGDDGADGTSSIVAQVYKRSSGAPSTPTGGSYNFTTSTLTPPSTWSATPPATDGNPLYVSTAIFSISGTTGTDSSTTWTTPEILVQDGADGAAAPGFVQLPVSFVSEAIGTLPQNASVVFNTDGTVTLDGYDDINWWSGAPVTAIGDDYQVRCSALLANSWDIQAAAVGTWITMSSARTWSMIRTSMEGTGSDVVSATFQIRKVGTATIDDEATVSAEAADA